MQNRCMLSKNNLKAIGEMLDKKFEENDKKWDEKLKVKFSDFFQDVLVPYFDQEHKEIMEKFENIDEHLQDHEKRIDKLEVITRAN